MVLRSSPGRGNNVNVSLLSFRGLPALCGFAIVVASFLPASGTAKAAECPNEVFRTGLSAELPDCRAYELVTPRDSNGRLVEGFSTFGFAEVSDMFPTELGSPVEDSFVYMTYNSPLLNPAGPTGTFDMYQAQRLDEGWQTTRRLTPGGAQSVLPYPGGVSVDHRYTFTKVAPFNALGGEHPGGSLAAEGVSDNLSSPDESFERVGIGSLGTERLAQGRYVSEGGEHVVFVTGNLEGQSFWCGGSGEPCKQLKLEPDAAPTGTGAIYDRSADGETKVISLLPGDVPAAAGEEAFYQGTSKDASVVAFKIKGTLYVRIENKETLKVTEAESTYAGLSDDGHYLFYVSGGDIHRFDTESGEDEEVNSTGDAEVVNVSADGSHVYFVSKSQIGGKGTAGQPNMYVWSGGEAGFVATVLPIDLEQTSGDISGRPALTNWTKWAVNPQEATLHFGGPGADSSRATPDGTVLAFESQAQLTPYDNDSHTEIYRYDDADKGLICVSCNPLAEPATADAHFQDLRLVKPAMVIHNLSNNGSRVFFESSEALVARDADSVNDIYQWSEQAGVAGLDLISSGRSVQYPLLVEQSEFLPSPNMLLSVTPDGKDVFFLAQDQLVPQAGGGGTPAVYDSRVNGGFAEPEPPITCLEEVCKSPPSSFASSLPGSTSSEVVSGAGNVKSKRKKQTPHCVRAKGNRHRHCKNRKVRRRAAASTASSGARRSLTSSASAPSAPVFTSSTVRGEPSKAIHIAGSDQALATEEFPFEIELFGAKGSDPAAGEHPNITTSFVLTHGFNKISGLPETDARPGEISISLPPGLLGNVNAVPKCDTGHLIAFAACPIDSQVGVNEILATGFKKGTEPIYNIEPPHPNEEIARFGFMAFLYPAFIDVKVKTASDYSVTATVHDPPAQAALVEAKTTLWGNPADSSHDSQRLTAREATECFGPSLGTACQQPEGKREVDLPPTAFFTNPSACQPMPLGLQVKSYQRPGEVFTASTEMDPITDCVGLPFAPEFSAEATNPSGGAPSGLRTTLVIPQQSTEAVDKPSTSTMREARVTLPAGFGINPGAANGIGTCDEAQVGYNQEVDTACPDASKIGAAEISSPLLPHPIAGEIFLRDQRPGHPYGLWLASDELGLHVKIPGDLEPNKDTGQLTAIFTDLPQTPVSEIELNVWGGARAPLTTPEQCGTYEATWSFKPHSEDPAVTGTSPIAIDQGCGPMAFNPKLHAGTTNPVAGAYSPFEFDLQRSDSEQNLASLDLTLPDGLLAKLAGVPLCPEAAAPSGSCPSASKIGSLSALAGTGPAPLWIPQPGKAPTAVYFAGPYKSAPYSILAVVPAQAGPFDLGNVVVRSALQVDPESARATVVSGPLPQFFEGVGVTYRRVHVVVDRPEFMLNPTDCSEMAIASHLTSVRGAVAEPSSRFQVDNCKALKYKPRLKLELKGGTKRSDHPAVRALLTQPPHQANAAAATVVLPTSEFIDQDHINSPCTRVQFRESKCPKLSVLGRATAISPLLDEPLMGPVYFRSNGGERELPDIVADLHGPIHVTLVGFVDAVQVKGTEKSRIRTRFARIPDAPVTKFAMNLFGGAKRGLLENSRDLCRTNRRAKVTLLAQNGRRIQRNQLIETSCARKGKR
jgi:hypothetical protein